MSQKFMKRLYDVETFQRFIADAVASFADMRKSRKNPDISAAFSKRILLAVTHVNGCRYCTFVHTKNALEEGMSEDEVQRLLGGEFDAAPSNESVALLFAEHYADSAGRPSLEATQKLIETYGADTAAQILGILRGIMVGNLHGNMIDALRNRIMRKPVPESTLGRELGIVLGVVVFVPYLAIKQLITSRTSPTIQDLAGQGVGRAAT